jgi:hypothetical protein
MGGPGTDEGYLVLPRRIGWSLVGGGLLYAIGTGWIGAGYVGRLRLLELTDQRFERDRIEQRSDIDRRIAHLEQSQDRITRLEEQVKISIEMLKDIRAELKHR